MAGTWESPPDIQEDRIEQAKGIFSFDRRKNRAGHRDFPELNHFGHKGRVQKTIEAIFARQLGPREIAAFFQAVIDLQRKTASTATRARGLE